MPIYLDTRGPNNGGGKMKPPPRPITRTYYTPRAKDRISDYIVPWSPEQIARALRAAEEGDLTQLADLMDHMLDRDPELGGYVQTRKLAVAGLRWSVQPANDTPEAKRAYDIVREQLSGLMDFRGAILDASEAVPRGISALETDWREDRTVAALRWINTKRYRFDRDTDDFMVMPDSETAFEPERVNPQEYKFVVHIPRIFAEHATRAAFLRKVAFAFVFRNYMTKDWATFIEVFGMPVRIAKYPANIKDAEKDELLDMLRLLGSDSYAIFDNRVETEFMEAMNRGASPHEAFFKAMGRQYAMLFVGQDQTNTQNEFGSRAQVVAGGAPIRQDLLEADCEDLSTTFRLQLFYPIVGWNMDWAAADRSTPLLQFEYAPPTDYDSYAAVDETVHTVLKLPTTWGAMAARYGRELPKGINPETIVLFSDYVPPGIEGREYFVATTTPMLPAAPPTDPSADGGDEPPAPRKPTARARRQALRQLTGMIQGAELTTPVQQRIDARANTVVPRARRAARGFTDPVIAIIANSTSLEEMEQRLGAAYPDLDESEFEELLRREIYAMRLFGQVVGEDRTDDGDDETNGGE